MSSTVWLERSHSSGFRGLRVLGIKRFRVFGFKGVGGARKFVEFSSKKTLLLGTKLHDALPFGCRV